MNFGIYRENRPLHIDSCTNTILSDPNWVELPRMHQVLIIMDMPRDFGGQMFGEITKIAHVLVKMSPSEYVQYELVESTTNIGKSLNDDLHPWSSLLTP